MDAKLFRETLSHFATGVTVVTANGPSGPVGITVNSFASLSLDPPLVLWSVDKASRRQPIFVAAESSAIHILRDDQQSVAQSFTSADTTFDGLRPNQFGVPCLPDCLARLDCRLREVLEGGDHFILVSEVVGAEVKSGEPLIFFRGGFLALEPT